MAFVGIFAAISRTRQRSKRHFTAYRDAVTQENFRTLRRCAVCFEAVLVLYGTLFARLFHSRGLMSIYWGFLALNTVSLVILWLRRKKGPPPFWRVQTGCMAFLIQILAFVICVSIFPFPDRPAIFYPLVYMLSLPLFQFPFWQTSLMLTAVTGIFCALAVCCKTPIAWAYDLSGAVTAWLLGFVELVVVLDLHIRNGEARMELDRQCRTDPLTGLPNRRDMDEFFALTHRRCAKLKIPLGVIMLDVDNFKTYNDRFGHPAGDACLVALGQTLSSFAKEFGFFAARYGGEEFILILPGCGEDRVAAHAETLLRRLPFQGKEDWTVTVSLGGAVEIPSPNGSLQDLVARADRALYQAKAEGRNRYVLDRQDH